MFTFEVVMFAGTRTRREMVEAQTIVLHRDDYVFWGEDEQAVVIIPRSLVEIIRRMPNTSTAGTITAHWHYTGEMPSEPPEEDAASKTITADKQE